jgi:ribosomal protein S18 acetylase RimI-like enzyme
MLPRISIESGGAELLEELEPHWRELRTHHVELAPIWQSELMSVSFPVRKEGLLKKRVNGLLVTVAKIGGQIVGYNVSTIDGDRRGEIDSLYVAAEHRSQGVGNEMVRRALEWFRAQPTTSIIVKVIAGNEGALRFYERLGFHARTIQLTYRNGDHPNPAQES